MRLGIVGNGVVGRATALAFREHEVRAWDQVTERCPNMLREVLDSELVFVCLPEGKLDWFFGYVCGFRPNAQLVNYVVRSTTPVGYCRKTAAAFSLTNLVHWPEFLTERSWQHDAVNPTRLVVGVPGAKVFMNQETGEKKLFFPGDNSCREILAGLLIETFTAPEPFGGADGPIPTFLLTSDESELVKLMQNAFSVVKVAFFNEVRSFSDKVGTDWQRVLEALLAGGWINPRHTQVPGPDGKRGFGGRCLPKDLKTLVTCMTEGLHPYVDLDPCPTLRAALCWSTADRRDG